MAQYDARTMMDAASTPAARGSRVPHRIAEAAERAAAEPVVAAMSPIVLAGAVRMIEIALVALIGTLIYVGYVVPQDGVQWQYFGAIAGVSAAGDAGVPGRRHLPGARRFAAMRSSISGSPRRGRWCS